MYSFSYFSYIYTYIYIDPARFRNILKNVAVETLFVSTTGGSYVTFFHCHFYLFYSLTLTVGIVLA